MPNETIRPVEGQSTPTTTATGDSPLKKYCGLQMDLLSQLCVAESSTKTKSLIPPFAKASDGWPVRRLDLTQDRSVSLPQYFFN